ncbi:MAG: segregation/condensation protein A [Gammaproteobacteria bacterium]|jgi:segregation and condensation protein A|nr:segregation/condensation protein A [Gammaproteobacteria bacterium]
MSTPGPRETKLAVVEGRAVTELPHDLYIPPDALEVFLETFEGPLDLLLYLIRKQNIDILDIPIAEVTRQYMAYIELMQLPKIELAGEYLVMAAVLAEIKSRMLLPRPSEEQDEEDPRAELVRRLQEYERYRKVAEDLHNRPRVGRDIHVVVVDFNAKPAQRVEPSVTLFEVTDAFKRVMQRAEHYRHHHVLRERLSVRERMSQILSRVGGEEFVDFDDLFDVSEGKIGLVVTFLAILELLKEALLVVVQAELFASIHVKAAT